MSHYNSSHFGYRPSAYSHSRRHGYYNYHQNSPEGPPSPAGSSRSSYSSNSNSISWSVRRYDDSDYRYEETASSRVPAAAGKYSDLEKKYDGVDVDSPEMNYNGSYRHQRHGHGYYHDRYRSNSYSHSRRYGHYYHRYSSESEPISSTSRSSYSSSCSTSNYVNSEDNNGNYNAAETSSSFSTAETTTTTAESNSEAEKKETVTISPEMDNIAQEIMLKLKSRGIFDGFRKECLVDVDTKPAYINLNSLAKRSVDKFLKELNWTPTIPKVQTRESIRKYISDSRFFDSGIDRIVDQVVNPKINSIFYPMIEELVYSSLGMEKEKPKDAEHQAEDQLVHNEATENNSGIREIVPEGPKEQQIKLSSKEPEGLSQPENQSQPSNSDIVQKSAEDIKEIDDSTSNEVYSDLDSDDEEEESPPFELIGDSPPLKSKNSGVDVTKRVESDDVVVLNDGSNSVHLVREICPPCRIVIKYMEPSELALNCSPKKGDQVSKNSPVSKKPNKKLWTIPEDVEDTPVYYLEEIPSLAEKLKFYMQFKEQ